jgi:ABC-type multidrug transport system ATPase subunit
LPDARYVLRAEGIGKYFGSLEALKAASVWAEPGRVTTLMGRNGSGKTTLMRVAVGLLRADRGGVTFLGEAYEHPRLPVLARRGLMYLPQSGSLCWGYRVSDHFDALTRGFGAARIDEAIDRCDVAPLLDQRARELSSGERRRVFIALAYARRPAALVADEPLVGLAPGHQESLGRLLRDLAAQGTAVVTSGHDAHMLMAISDTIIWSAAGTTHYLGSPEEAVAHHQFRREYLGPLFRLE